MRELAEATRQKFIAVYGYPPTHIGYAPGRVEVLGNHTDYNGGLVLSAALQRGTCFAAAGGDSASCRLTAGDLMRTVGFEVDRIEPTKENSWANYIKGVVVGLHALNPFQQGFDALFFSNIPLGAGLSSSAALEVSAAFALSALYDIGVDKMGIARIAQRAEHEYAGVKCGLLDQISSIFGVEGSLLLTDFSTLAISTVPLSEKVVLLVCNTHAKHALMDGVFNSRRAECRKALQYFQALLDPPVEYLCEVSPEAWKEYKDGLDPTTARRASHPIHEQDRVRRGTKMLGNDDVVGFGQLMFQSHRSSRDDFENSSAELDCLVDLAGNTAGVLGARLTGGGFGGGVVMMVETSQQSDVSAKIADEYGRHFGHACDIIVVSPGEGAKLLSS